MHDMNPPPQPPTSSPPCIPRKPVPNLPLNSEKTAVQTTHPIQHQDPPPTQHVASSWQHQSSSWPTRKSRISSIYHRLSLRTKLIILGIVLIVLALILGLSIGLTRDNGGGNKALPLGSQTYSGDLTYYGPGLGACGKTSSSRYASLLFITFLLIHSRVSLSASQKQPSRSFDCNFSCLIQLFVCTITLWHSSSPSLNSHSLPFIFPLLPFSPIPPPLPRPCSKLIPTPFQRPHRLHIPPPLRQRLFLRKPQCQPPLRPPPSCHPPWQIHRPHRGGPLHRLRQDRSRYQSRRVWKIGGHGTGEGGGGVGVVGGVMLNFWGL